MTTLRLATYNLHDLLDDGAALRRVLACLEADVVCVQEVPRTPWGDLQARRLARAVGLRAPWTHAGGGGTTVFVGPRVQVRDLRHLPLGVPAGQRRRGVAVLDAALDGSRFQAISLHLGLHPVQRVRHAEQIDVLIRGPRVVVAGDANESTDGPALARLRRRLSPLGAAPPTFPARRPEHAIDVVLGRGWAGVRELSPTAAQDDLERASDHRPRLLDLTL